MKYNNDTIQKLVKYHNNNFNSIVKHRGVPVINKGLQFQLAITSYLNSNECLFKFDKDEFTNIYKIYEIISKEAFNYVNWCSHQNSFLTRNEELKSLLKDHFIGFFGELYFYYILKNCTIIINKKPLKMYNVLFNSPKMWDTVIGKKWNDFGVDLLAFCNNDGKTYPIVIQVKMHNPAIKQADIVTVTNTDHVAYQGAKMGWINVDDEHNVLWCYTGKEDGISSQFNNEKNPSYNTALIFENNSIKTTFNILNVYSNIADELNGLIEYCKINNF